MVLLRDGCCGRDGWEALALRGRLIYDLLAEFELVSQPIVGRVGCLFGTVYSDESDRRFSNARVCGCQPHPVQRRIQRRLVEGQNRTHRTNANHPGQSMGASCCSWVSSLLNLPVYMTCNEQLERRQCCILPPTADMSAHACGVCVVEQRASLKTSRVNCQGGQFAAVVRLCIPTYPTSTVNYISRQDIH